MIQGGRFSHAPARFGHSAVIFLTVVLGLMSIPPARAMSPAPPPPCPKSFNSEPIARLVEQVKGFGEDEWAAGCASEALSRKGENVVPVLLSLMETNASGVESFALGAVCGPGHSGAAAVPYIERRLRAGGLSFAISAYPALACIGRGAQPAIPLLIDKSLGVALNFPAEGDLATETLGSLSQYDPDRIIPHLIRLLDQPAHIVAAARALEKIGKPAHSAEQVLRRNLATAVDAKQDEVAVALISALGRLGSPRPTVAILIPLLDRPGEAGAAAQALGRIGPQAKPAVTALLNRLNAADTDWPQRADVVSSLAAIDVHSPVVLQALLDEVARPQNGVTDYLSADALAKVKPFPPELAPALVEATERYEAGDLVRHMLEGALAHTDTKLQPSASSRLPPHDVSDRLGDGLWALTVQSQPIVPDDLVKQLRIDLNDYVQEGNLISREWRRTSARVHGPGGAALIDSIHLFGTRQNARAPNGSAASAGLPDTQRLDVYLSARSCISVDDLKARLAGPEPATPDPSVVIVSDYSSLRDSGTLRFEGDHSADKSKARSSVISVGPGCRRYINIEKSFDPAP
jgi:hypothetical protein